MTDSPKTILSARNTPLRPSRRQRVGVALLCSLLAWPLPGISGDPRNSAELRPGPQWQAAQQAFNTGRWAAAYGRFMLLADTGHVPSAEVALLMLRHGPALFGSAFSASQPQQARWTKLVVESARRQRQVDLAGQD